LSFCIRFHARVHFFALAFFCALCHAGVRLPRFDMLNERAAFSTAECGPYRLNGNTYLPEYAGNAGGA